MKEFAIGPGKFQLWAEVFNVFNTANGGFNDQCCGPASFPSSPDLLFGPPRSLQLGAAYRF